MRNTTRARRFGERAVLVAGLLCAIATSRTDKPPGKSTTLIPWYEVVEGVRTVRASERIELTYSKVADERIVFDVEDGEVTIRVASDFEGTYQQSECFTLSAGERRTTTVMHVVDCTQCEVMLAFALQFEGNGKVSWKTSQREAEVDPDLGAPEIDSCMSE